MKTTKEIKNYAVQQINDMIESGDQCYACDLHHRLFNTDYFIIGKYDAQRWLENNVGIFEAIDEVKEYEVENWGELTTDLSSPEKVCNMYVFIKGEAILNDCDTLMDRWDEELTEDDLMQIMYEIEIQYKKQ